MRMGFACAWDQRPETTWSNTPWSLRRALLAHTDVVDVGVYMPRAVRLALKGLYARRHNGNWVSMWKHSAPAIHYNEASVRRNERERRSDMVVQIQDLAIIDTPYLVLQDLSYDLLLDEIGERGRRIQFPTLSDDDIKRLRDRQLGVYERAAGILAMSKWFGDHLVRVTGLSPGRVHVVHPGASAIDAVPATSVAARQRRLIDGPPRRLLFVGRDFARKGGEQVVRALRVLRSEFDPEITLTVVGPDVWPMAGEVPDGVRFLGRLPVDRVAAVYDEHDVFVMPSRFEAFGIVLAEALARGLPCVARQAFAMPEIIRPGDNGELIRGDDPNDLAVALVRVLADHDMFRRVADQAADTREHFSWDRAAQDVLSIAGLLPGLEVAR